MSCEWYQYLKPFLASSYGDGKRFAYGGSWKWIFRSKMTLSLRFASAYYFKSNPCQYKSAKLMTDSKSWLAFENVFSIQSSKTTISE